MNTNLDNSTPALFIPVTTPPAQDRREVVFIDTGVADYQTLVEGVRAGVEVVLIESGQSGLAQMAEWAQTHRGYEAIHVLSHGSEGTLYLGADTLNQASLADADVQTQLTVLGQSLTAEGDFLIYGCDVAKGDAGTAFINAFAAATGADVAASDDLTGANWLGGDWEQEKNQGTIEANALEFPDFDSVLPAGDEWATHGGAISQDMVMSVGASFLTNGGKAAAYLKQVSGDSQTWDPTGPAYNAYIDVISASSLITKTIDVKEDLLSGRSTDITNFKLSELKNGGFVATWIESDGMVYYAIFDNAGATDGSHLLSSNASTSSYAFDVTSLQDGGFVIAYLGNIGAATKGVVNSFSYNAGDYSKNSEKYFADSGNSVPNPNNDLSVNHLWPLQDFSIAALSDGGFVIGSDSYSWVNSSYTPLGDFVYKFSADGSTENFTSTGTYWMRVNWFYNQHNSIAEVIAFDGGFASLNRGLDNKFEITLFNNDGTRITENQKTASVYNNGSYSNKTYYATDLGDVPASVVDWNLGFGFSSSVNNFVDLVECNGSVVAILPNSSGGFDYTAVSETTGSITTAATSLGMTVPSGATLVNPQYYPSVSGFAMTYDAVSTTTRNDSTYGDLDYLISDAYQYEIFTTGPANTAPTITELDSDSTIFDVGNSEYIDNQDSGNGLVVDDSDSTDFNGGYLIISLISGTADGSFLSDLDDDVVKFGLTEGDAGGSPAGGDTVYVREDGTGGYVAIGTVHATNNGQSGADFRIDFNTAGATPGNVSELLKYLKYTTTTPGTRVFSTLVNDGDGDSSAPSSFTMIAIDGTPPSFISATIANVAENTTNVLTVTSTDATAVSYTIVSVGDGGAADADKFTLDSSTGALAFASAPDYESPTDQGDTAGNNTYTVTVRATDTATNTADQTITVTVTNANDSPVVIAGTSTAFTEQTPTAIAPALDVADVEGNWDGGTLKVQITGNASADDSLLLPTTSQTSGIWVNGIGTAPFTLYDGSTPIGTASASGVTGGTEWVFTFNASATNTLVQAVAQTIQFGNGSNDPSTANRTVTFTATDAASASNFATQTVTITPVNDAPEVTNRTDPALTFSGATTSYAAFPDIDNQISTAFTLETWVKFSSLNGPYAVQFIAGKGTSGAVEQMELHTNGNALRFIPTGGAYIDTGAVLTTDQWIHIAASYDADTDISKIYINGVEVAAQDNHPGNPIDDPLKSTTDPYHLGIRGDGSYPLNGTIAEYRIWNDVRTADEIRNNMDVSLAGNEANLVALWTLDENTGTALADSTTSHFNGTAHDATWTTRPVSGGLNVTYTEGAAPVNVFNGASVTTVESGQLITGLTLTLADLADGASEKLVVDGTAISLTQGTSGTSTGGASIDYSVSVSGSTATVTLSKTATAADWQGYVDRLQYRNDSDNPTTSSGRTVTLTSITDSGGSANGANPTASLAIASTVGLSAVNDVPAIADLGGDSHSYSIGGSAITLDAAPALNLADPDHGTLASAAVQITDAYQFGEDVLAFSNTSGMGNIAGSWNGANGTLMLTSAGATATLVEWAAALQAVTYSNTDASTVNTSPRTITFTVNDGTADSTGAVVTVNLVRAPIIDLDTAAGGNEYSGSFTEDGGAVAVTGTPAISDDGTFKALSVTLTNKPDGVAESLASTYGTGAQTVNGEAVTLGVYNGTTGELAITINDGSADATTLQLLMASIRYDNNSQSPGTTSRVITFAATDNDDHIGSAAQATLTLGAVNDAPTVATHAGLTLAEGATTPFGTAALSIDDVDTAAASRTLTLGTAPVNGTLYKSSVAMTAGSTFTQADIDANAITYTHNGGETTTDSFTFTVSDGAGGGIGETTFSFTITPVNDAPTLTGLDAAIYTFGDVPQTLDGELTIGDVELDLRNSGSGDYNGTQLVLQREGGANTGDDFGFGAAVTVTSANLSLDGGTTTIATFSKVGGTLTINFASSGAIARNQAEALMEAITYRNTGSTAGDVTLEWKLYDDAGSTGLLVTAAQTLTLSDNASPVITSNDGGATAVFDLAEQQTAVTTVTASDADDDPVTFSLTGGADQSKFTLDASTGVLSFVSAPDFEAPGDADANNTYVVDVTASDGRGGTDVQTITVSVLSDIDRDGTPDTTDIDIDGDGLLNSSEDPVPGANNVTGDGNGDGTPDREQANVVSLPTVGTGTADQKWGTLAVAEGLTLSNVSNSAASGLPRNAKMPVGQFDFMIEGVTEGGSVTVDLYVDKTLNTNGYYKKVGSTWTNIGTVSTAGTKTKISFTLTDGGLYDDDGLANGVIVDPGGAVLLAPLIISNGGEAGASINVAENGTAVTTVVATQPPASGAITYSLTGGADAAKFSINASTGVLTFASAPNYESPTDDGANNSYIVEITASDNVGSTDTQTLTVSVTNVNEAPPDVDEPPVIDPSDPPPPDEWGQLPDDDGDGVPEVIEDFVPSLAPRDGSAPVPGDGNGDGIADRLQTDVASIPFRHTDEISQNPQAPVTFVTLAIGSDEGGAPTGGSSITAARQLDAPAVGEGLGERSADLDLPLGLISFSATVPEPEAPVSFSLYVSGDVPINGYWKPTANGWVNLASPEYGGQMVMDGDKIRLDFVIEDNGLFDDDPTPGVIGDPGGPGYMQSVPGQSECPYDPFKPDADRDGMPDSVEAALGFDSALKDNDVQGNDTLFVRQLYRDLLGREGEAQEVAHWAQSLEQGQSHAQVVSAFVASAECDAHAGAIVRLYHAVLGRTPDYCGFNYWVGRSLDGLTAEEMGTAFLQSAEFVGNNPSLSDEAFVDLLYQNVLGRAADAPGKAYWLDRIAQGESRGEVLYGFAQSGEYKAAMADEVAVDLLYLGLLDRAPDQAGWDYWHTQWGQFDDTVQFYDTAMSVPEYAERFVSEMPPVSLVGVEAVAQG